MEGNAKIIRLICRDENLHLAATQMMLRLMKKEDEMYRQIAEECHDEVQSMFLDANRQEKEWAEYLFKDGSLIGLNTAILCQYVDYITAIRMNAVNVKCPFSAGKNPIPWSDKWITSSDVQVAPQETEQSSYIIGGIDNDINKETFKSFKL